MRFIQHLLLICVREKFVVFDEIYPEYNAGYNYGPSMYCIIDPEEGYEPDPEVWDYQIIGRLPYESKIC